MRKTHWYDYLWIWSIVYFTLGFFNILFAWLGLIDFFVPLLIAVFGGNNTEINEDRTMGPFGVPCVQLVNSSETGRGFA